MLVGCLDFGAVNESESAPDEDGEAEIAAPLSPVDDLFSEGRADQADVCVAVGEDGDAVGTATNFATQPLARIVRPDFWLFAD